MCRVKGVRFRDIVRIKRKHHSCRLYGPFEVSRCHPSTLFERPLEGSKIPKAYDKGNVRYARVVLSDNFDGLVNAQLRKPLSETNSGFLSEERRKVLLFQCRHPCGFLQRDILGEMLIHVMLHSAQTRVVIKRNLISLHDYYVLSALFRYCC